MSIYMLYLDKIRGGDCVTSYIKRTFLRGTLSTKYTKKPKWSFLLKGGKWRGGGTIRSFPGEGGGVGGAEKPSNK